MSVGIFINGKRPASKKAVKDAVAAGDLSVIELENTSMFDNKFDCSLEEIVRRVKEGEMRCSAGKARVDFVGPDPFTTRNFYGNINITSATGKVTIS